MGTTLWPWPSLLLAGYLTALAVAGAYLIQRLLSPLEQLAKHLPEAAKEVTLPSLSFEESPRDEAALLTEIFGRILEDSRKKKLHLDQLLKDQAGRAKEMDRALEKKVYDLFTLFEVAKELNATLDPDTILKTVVFTCMAHLGVTNTTLVLLDNYLDQNASPEWFVPVILRGLDERLRHDIRFRPQSDFVQYLAKAGRPVTRREIEELLLSDEDAQALAQLHYALCAPLAVKEQLKGMLFVGPKKSSTQGFSQGNLELLGTLIGLAALALENARLYTLAITDGLTKVYTHRFLQLRLKEEMQRSHRYKHPLTAIMIDVDHFKKVNDTHGHPFGDHVLIQVAACCRAGLRGSDFVARYGGEEFVLILPEVDEQQALVAAERIRKSVEGFPFQTPSGQAVAVTISLGLASYPRSATDERELIARADRALYTSKQQGRNKCTIFQ